MGGTYDALATVIGISEKGFYQRITSEEDSQSQSSTDTPEASEMSGMEEPVSGS